MDSTRTGGCLCGQIRYLVTGSPRDPHSCSCEQCRRHSGAPTQVWIELDKASCAGPVRVASRPSGAPRLRRAEPSARTAVPRWAPWMTVRLSPWRWVAWIDSTMTLCRSFMLSPTSDRAGGIPERTGPN